MKWYVKKEDYPLFAGGVALIILGFSGFVWAWMGSGERAALMLITGFSVVAVLVGLVLALVSFDPKVKLTPKFCADCGKKMTTAKAQHGFDMKTGRAKIENRLQCPDWSRTPSGYPNSSDGIFCGNRKVTKFESSCHEPRDYTCPLCRDFLVNAGAMSQAQADLLAGLQ